MPGGRLCNEHGGQPVGQEVNVLAGTLQDATCRDRVPAGEREPVLASGSQTDLSQPAVDRRNAIGH